MRRKKETAPSIINSASIHPLHPFRFKRLTHPLIVARILACSFLVQKLKVGISYIFFIVNQLSLMPFPARYN